MKPNRKKRNSLICIFGVTVSLFMILFGVQLSYAGPDVIYKGARPKKDLTKKEEQVKEYVYNPAGKVDPFASFIIKHEQGLKDTQEKRGRDKGSEWKAKMEGLLRDLKEPRTELQRIDISELTLTSVIKGKDKVWAMVSDPDGRGYLLQKGTYIGTNGGVVDEIICKDKKTPFGIESVRKITITEPFYDQGKELDYKSIEMKMPFATHK